MFLIWLFCTLSLSFRPCHFLKILLMWKDFPSYLKHMEWKLAKCHKWIVCYIAELKTKWAKYSDARNREDIQNQTVRGGEA